MSATIVGKSRKYVEDEENDEPFVHAEWLYTTKQDKNGRMQTVRVENPLVGKPKLITRYRAPNQRTDERYLCMPFKPEKESYLSLLPHELYLKFFGKHVLVNITIACHMCVVNYASYPCVLLQSGLEKWKWQCILY